MDSEKDFLIKELVSLHLRRKKLMDGWCCHPATESLEIEMRLYAIAARAWLITKDETNG